MQQWEYQTLIARQGADAMMEVTHVNNKETEFETTGRIFQGKRYTLDLPSFLGKAGRDGWEVVSTSPITAFGASSGASEGAIHILVILKRPVSA